MTAPKWQTLRWVDEPPADLAARLAALLAEIIELRVHVLIDVDERGHREFVLASDLTVLDRAWVRDGNVDRKQDGVLVLGCRRRT